MKIFCILLFFVATIFAKQSPQLPKFSADSILIAVKNFQSPAAVFHLKKVRQPKVYVWFHGGMQSAKCAKGYEAANALVPFLEKSKSEAIAISVSACKENHWLSNNALLVVDKMLDSVEMRFHIRIDSVSLVGVSDGGLGIAGYTLYGKRSIRSRLLVSTNLSAVADAKNLAQDPKIRQGAWTFLQGGSDRLYPRNQTLPWMEKFCAALGVKKCRIHFDENGEHDWSWWTTHRAEWIQEFIP